MFAVLEDAVSAIKDAAADFSQISGRDAMRLVQICIEGERALAAVRTLAARRVDESKVWQVDGDRTAAEWIARRTGTGLGQAISVLETARRLEELPLIKTAFCSGRLSEVQAREIADAAYVDPRQERALVASAQTQTVKKLREECARVKAAAIPDELERLESIRRRRYLKHWTEADGAVRLDARLTPVDGAQVIAAIDSTRNKIFTEARATGLRESSQAYAADALVQLASSQGPKAMVHVLVDHKVLRSGKARSDQKCEIPGIGRIPAATARALAEDAIIKAIETKGTDIQQVAHLGRTIPARIRTALEVRDPSCVVPTCDKTNALEIDHYRIPYADGGPTRLDNLARLCRWHHYQKTHLGYRLTGEPGEWKWDTPQHLEGNQTRPPPDG